MSAVMYVVSTTTAATAHVIGWPKATLPDPEGTVITGITVQYDEPDFLGVNKSVDAYLGVRYAEPPVGALRFQDPKPYAYRGNYNATEDQAMCLQMMVLDYLPDLPGNPIKGRDMGEDCLFLSIYTSSPKVWVIGTDKDLAHPDSVNAVLVDYSGVTTAHGIPRIITSRSVKSRLFWSFVTLIASGAFLWQGSLLLIDYNEHPYTTQIDVIARTELQFPAVTVCNMNMMRRSAMVNTRFESLIQTDDNEIEGDADYAWWFGLPTDEASASAPTLVTGSSTSSSDSSSDAQEHYSEQAPALVTGSSTSSSDSSSDAQEHYSEQAPALVTGSSTSSSDSSSDAQEHYSEQAPALVTGSSTSSSDSSSDAQEHYIEQNEWWAQEHYSEQYEWWESGWDTDDFDYQSYDWDDVTDDDDWEGFYKQSTADDFSDLLEAVHPTREELKVMGHQAEDFLLQCTFDRRRCTYKDFHQFQNKYYGNCFTFNREVGNSTRARSTRKTGAQYGLHLTLFTEHPEYVGLFAQEAGVRVAIHPPNVFPFPEDDGVVASTGQATDIAMRQSYFKRLPHPHGNCTDRSRTNFTSEEYAYTTRACVKSCVQQQLFDKCGCVTDIIMNETFCSPRNRSQQVCRQATEQFYNECQLPWNCPIACEETLFVTSVTSSLWPSKRYESHLKTRLTNEKAKRALDNVEHTRNNLARVRIYFEELNYEQMIQNPKYTIESLLGGIGGLLGLYIGFSVITVCEVGVLVVDLVKFLFRKAYSRNKVVPIDFKS
eukprot:XP_011681790.1 PREDICTED: amiloride-sensitive sodium channel subunit alpha-like [Strongylocentrotus purpuratus]